MLVLSRQRNQAIIIGDEIEITVVDIRGDKVRLGINAPRSVSVHRKEIYDLVKLKNQSAAGAAPAAERSEPGSNGNAAHVGNGADPFLRAAIDEARAGLSEGGLPIGS